MIFDKHRFEIWNQAQHPYKHTLTDFSYVSEALPGVSNVEDALNWIIAVLYPNAKGDVANVAALPLVGNTLNDYRVVLDDGDGNAAGYRWEQREGEVSPSWHKVFDFDWSTDAILAAFTDITQDLYVYQKGKTDLDASGAAITGVLAGQRIFGGNQANQNLTLSANSGDGVGAGTGYVQVTDHFRPTATATLDVGTSTEKFRTGYFSLDLYVDTLSLSAGSITDSGGVIDFGVCNLTTTGDVFADEVEATTQVRVGTLGAYLNLGAGSISDDSGIINFGTNDLQNIDEIQATSVVLNSGGLTLSSASINSSAAGITFNNRNLTSVGTIGATTITGTQVNADNLRLDGNTLSATDTNGNLILQANGTGIVDVQNPLQTLGQTVTGVIDVTGQLNVDNLRLDGNVISSTNANGNITLTPNGTGLVEVTASVQPNSNNALDLGAGLLAFRTLYLDTSISDGTDSISMTTLLSFRDALVGAASGMTLFYDGAKWNASAPDSEIDHGTLSFLGDDDHTQYALLAGRATGQTLNGGTAASENLTLDSTAHGTKGFIYFSSVLAPTTNASYSGGWSGTDIGGVSNYVRHLYTKGEHFGLRLENVNPLPSFSAQNVGRLVFDTSVSKVYVDDGTQFKIVGATKYENDTSWNGSDTTKTVTTSGLQDTRKAIWQLRDNTNDFEIMQVKITTPNATDVVITVNVALPAGSYRLIGIEV